MAFSLNEIPNSRSSEKEPPSITFRYKAVGEQSDSAVRFFAASMTPVNVAFQGGLLKRQNIRVDPDGWNQYHVEITYGQKSKDTGQFSFNFDTTGATIKIKAAKEHIKTYNADGSDGGDPHKSVIGVKADGDVEGADIIIPALKLTYQYKHGEGVVTEGYAKQLAAATGFTNKNHWRVYDAGELLFAGATGSDGTDTEAEVSYTMIASQNRDDLTVGDIAAIVKAGHHYAWVEMQDEVSDDGAPSVQPRRVHIERVYDAIDFRTALGWE
jgi:hypothetical protein